MTTCQWCEARATTKVLLEPTRYRTVTTTDPQTGEKRREQEVAQFAIHADACKKHANVSDRTPGQPIPDPRRRKATGVEQRTIFDELGMADPKHKGPADAIRGPEAA